MHPDPLETLTEFGITVCAIEQEKLASPITFTGEFGARYTEYIMLINHEGLLEYEEEAVASINNK